GEVTGQPDDAFTKVFSIIPDGTSAIAKIEKMTNQDFMGAKTINIEWVIVKGDFKGRKITHKLKVFDEDNKKRHRALNMLKLIYSMFNDKPEGTEAPSDKDFLKLVGKEAGI